MAKQRENPEVLKIRLAEALKKFRDGSKASTLYPKIRRNKTQRKFGILRNAYDCFKGMDRNFLQATKAYGWIKRARPEAGGREGDYWDGPGKVFQAKALEEIIDTYYTRRDDYEAQRKKELAKRNQEAAEIAQREADKIASIDASTPPPAVEYLPQRIEVAAVFCLPENYTNMLGAYHACSKAGVPIPGPVSAFMALNGLDENTETTGEVDLLSGTHPYAKVLDDSGNVVSVDLKKMAEDDAAYDHLVIRVRSVSSSADE
jgi:hypothetical protein